MHTIHQQKQNKNHIQTIHQEKQNQTSQTQAVKQQSKRPPHGTTSGNDNPLKAPPPYVFPFT